MFILHYKHHLVSRSAPINETEKELRGNILKLSNPTKAYLESNCEASNNVQDFIVETELYADFITFCNTENLPSIRKSQFTQALKEYLPNAKQTKEKILGENTCVYQFIKKKDPAPSVPSAPSPLLDAEKNTNFLKISKARGTEGTTSQAVENKPVFYVKDIPAGEKCDCGAFAVTMEILTPQKETIKRCTQCLEKLHQSFPNADWKAAYPEMPN